jgi:tetratricopeptide (TPR) repeat protein
MQLNENLKKIGSYLSVFLILTIFTTNLTNAQTPDEIASERKKAFELIKQDKYLEALPILETLVIELPEDADVSFYYGFTLLAKAQTTINKTEAMKMRINARKALLKAKSLGSDISVIDSFIESIPPDGSLPPKFSKNAGAENMMIEGERAFTKGNYDEAIKLYGKALELDPKIYFAALFTGDMYLRKEEFDKAEIWYQKAIAIDPNIETAYRYSATPLMRQKKYDAARDRYIEAFIVEPYSRFAVAGISQWAEATDARLGHPRIDVPIKESVENGKPKTTISISPTEDGSAAWLSYTATRVVWKDKEFAKNFPNEKEYRHTLKEEAEAFRSVVRMAKDLKSKGTKLNEQIETLIELDTKGLLEAYILMALPDQGIAQDHAEYLKNHRDKLRQYVKEYVIIKE